MQHLSYRHTVPSEYVTDASAIAMAFARLGYEVSSRDAYMAWRDYSDSVCAGWIVLDGMSDDDIVMYAIPYLRES
jgi:hypothetical protein